MNPVPKEIKTDVMGISEPLSDTLVHSTIKRTTCIFLQTLITIQRSNIITSYYQIGTNYILTALRFFHLSLVHHLHKTPVQ